MKIIGLLFILLGAVILIRILCNEIDKMDSKPYPKVNKLLLNGYSIYVQNQFTVCVNRGETTTSFTVVINDSNSPLDELEKALP